MQDFFNSLLSSLDAAKFIGTNPFAALVVSYLAGLLTAFTPCVWPVYPLSFSVISKISSKNSSGSKWATLFYLIVFVAGISIVFAMIGLLSGIFGAGFQSLLRTGVFMIVTGVIFILLSLSMFGVYEISLPYFITKRINNKPNKKSSSIASIFLMGAFSGFIASPCVVAPLAGILMLIAASGEVFTGFVMLLVFGFGIGTPFFIIGIAGTSKIVPSSGNWMKAIQYIMGVVLFVLGSFLIYNQISFYTQKDKAIETFDPYCDSITGVCYFNFETGEYITEQDEKDLFWRGINSIELLDQYYEAERPFILKFTADWCTYCQIMDEESFNTDEFMEKAYDVNWLVTDATNADRNVRQLLSKYFVSGLPALLMFDGERDTTLYGYLTQKNLFNIMDEFYSDMRNEPPQFILDNSLFKSDTNSINQEVK